MTQKELLYVMDTVSHLKHFTEHLDKCKNNIKENNFNKETLNCKSLLDNLIANAKCSYQEYTNLVCNGGCN